MKETWRIFKRDVEKAKKLTESGGDVPVTTHRSGERRERGWIQRAYLRKFLRRSRGVYFPYFYTLSVAPDGVTMCSFDLLEREGDSGGGGNNGSLQREQYLLRKVALIPS